MATERKFQDALFEVLNDIVYTDKEDLDGGADAFVDMVGKVDYVRSYEEAGLLTMNKGLVVTLESGDEFQVCIVQSYHSPNQDDEDADDEQKFCGGSLNGFSRLKASQAQNTGGEYEPH